MFMCYLIIRFFIEYVKKNKNTLTVIFVLEYAHEKENRITCLHP